VVGLPRCGDIHRSGQVGKASVALVGKVSQICSGKAYFTTPYTLGQFVLMDFLNKKTRMVH
jgi:Ca-activated chloride channel family protein